MTRPCPFRKDFVTDEIDEIVWGPNLRDLLASLQDETKFIRFKTKVNGEIWMKVRSMAVATRQDTPDQRNNWYITCRYTNHAYKETICLLDYDTSTGEGWIRLYDFKSVPV